MPFILNGPESLQAPWDITISFQTQSNSAPTNIAQNCQCLTKVWNRVIGDLHDNMPAESDKAVNADVSG